MAQNDLASAIESFARGVAATRCFTYPSNAELIDRCWVIRDVPRKGGRGYRREEWAAHGIDPAEVDAAARRGTRGRFCVCAIHAADESDVPLRAGYKAVGYRLHATEALMMHRLKPIPKVPVPFPISRVLTQELADRVFKAAGRRQILPQHLKTNDELRLYAALDGETPVGWLRSIVVGDCTWVSNVYTEPKYRRKGVGKSLLAKMLRDDLKYGSKQSVLTASHAGEGLYHCMGYEGLGTLLLFTPKR
jgi:GNAT superfamily N-acetyltransferase